MLSLGFDRSIKDACVYFKHIKNGYWVYLLLYVDDMLIASKDKAEIDRLKSELKTEFEMKDLGEARKILGMEIHRDRKLGLLRLSQKEYIQKVLARFSMEGAKAISTPCLCTYNFQVEALRSQKRTKLIWRRSLVRVQLVV